MTGAHIAYALAMKLKIETANKRRGSNEPSPCVMYCGPSQQSVNVVLSELSYLEINILIFSELVDILVLHVYYNVPQEFSKCMADTSSNSKLWM